MRFYSFNFSELDILPSHEPERALSATRIDMDERALNADFTRRPPPKTSTLNAEVLSQVSCGRVGKYMQIALTQGEHAGQSGSPTHRHRRLPTGLCENAGFASWHA